MKSLIQERRYLGLDLNPGPREYEVGVLTIQRRYFVLFAYNC
jgi:hypothetical protein